MSTKAGGEAVKRNKCGGAVGAGRGLWWRQVGSWDVLRRGGGGVRHDRSGEGSGGEQATAAGIEIMHTAHMMATLIQELRIEEQFARNVV